MEVAKLIFSELPPDSPARKSIPCSQSYSELVTQLTKEQMEEIEESFHFFDKDGNGAIDGEEICQVMRALGCDPDEKELQAMIDEFDIDGNGTIEFDEFVKMMAKKMWDKEQMRIQRMYEKVFNYLDTGRKGKIGAQDLRRCFSALGEKVIPGEVEDMITEGDLNNDGFVDLDEFSKLMEICRTNHNELMKCHSIFR